MTDRDLLREIRMLQRRVASLEATIAQQQTRDVRDAAGRLRQRTGLQDDGTYGLRVWDAAGVLQVNQTE